MMYLAATVFPAPLSPLKEDRAQGYTCQFYLYINYYCVNNRQKSSTKSHPPDDDTLVLTVNHHVSVHVVSQSIDVRGVLILGLEEDGQNNQKTTAGHLWSITVMLGKVRELMSSSLLRTSTIIASTC